MSLSLRAPLRALFVVVSAGVCCALAAAASTDTTLVVGSGVPLPNPLGGYGMSLTAADLNGDGRLDVVVGTNFGSPWMWLNNGTATPFQGVTPTEIAHGDTQQSAFAVDLDRDGHPDLVATGFNSPTKIYLNNGTASPFQSVVGRSIGPSDPSESAAFADLDGDGFPDMVVSNTNHIPSRLYLSGGQSLAAAVQTPVDIGTDLGYGADIKLADVNGDGRADVLIAYTVASSLPSDPSGVTVYLNNGSSTPFAGVTPLRLLVGVSAAIVAVVDLNGDGKPDLAVSGYDNAIGNANSILLNTGSGSQPFTSASTLTPSDKTGSCGPLAVADVNADSFPDVVIRCNPAFTGTYPGPYVLVDGASSGLIFLNNGTANPFANVAPVLMPAKSQDGFLTGLVIADLAGDHKLELVGNNADGPTVYSLTVDKNPVATNDTVAVSQDRTAEIDVLANDTDSDGSIDRSSLTLGTAPLHGVFRINPATMTVIYQPDSGFSGTDSFQYSVKDSLGAIAPAATVSISVQKPPVANDDATVVQSGQSVAISVLTNDTTTGTLNAASLTIVTAPLHGTASINGSAITYQAQAGYVGTDTLQYSVKDNLDAISRVGTVTVTVQAASSGGGGKGGGGAFDLLSLAFLAAGATLIATQRMRASAPRFGSKPSPRVLRRNQ